MWRTGRHFVKTSISLNRQFDCCINSNKRNFVTIFYLSDSCRKININENIVLMFKMSLTEEELCEKMVCSCIRPHWDKWSYNECTFFVFNGMQITDMRIDKQKHMRAHSLSHSRVHTHTLTLLLTHTHKLTL